MSFTFIHRTKNLTVEEMLDRELNWNRHAHRIYIETDGEAGWPQNEYRRTPEWSNTSMILPETLESYKYDEFCKPHERPPGDRRLRAG